MLNSSILLRAAVCATLACALAACGGRDDADRDSPGGRAGDAVGVVLETVRLARADERVEAVGTARARSTATLLPDTGGEVTEILFETGDFAEQDDPVLRLDSEEEELAVRLAEVAVAEAEQLLARYRRIEDTGAVSDSQIDEARTALDAALIERDQARLALSDRTVRAPFAGHLGLTVIDPGARITTETEIATLDDRSVLFVDFDLPEQAFGRIGVGDEVELAPFAGEIRAMTGRIIGIDSQVDAERRTFEVRARLDNADDLLRPGMSFRVGFSVAGEEHPVVPEVSIAWGSDGAYVWRADSEGRAERVPASIVARLDGEVLVDADLEDGDRVVSEGVQKVREDVELEQVEPGAVAGRDDADAAGAP